MATQYAQDIQTFKKGFDGGTRPNRFVVNGEIGGDSGENMPNLLVKAASMPAQTLGTIQVPFRGRVAKLPGDRIYPEWTFTALDTNTNGESSNSKNWRRLFEEWHAGLNQHKENTALEAETLSGLHEKWFKEWTVTQLDTQGFEIADRTIRLVNCWPTEIGAIDLSFDTADALNEYAVTLAYDWLVLEEGTGGGNN